MKMKMQGGGYKHCLAFSPPTASEPPNSDRKNRHRDIIWYNPPFSKNVPTNIGQTFLKILDEEFPKVHMLHKIFNRNTVKISYSCMTNLKQTSTATISQPFTRRLCHQKHATAGNQLTALWRGIVSRNP